MVAEQCICDHDLRKNNQNNDIKIKVCIVVKLDKD